jgi:aminoglycoside phosphotransferase (APT) family kinase protein
MIEQLKTFILENSTDWGLPAGEAWRFWVYNNWHPHCANLDIMWFHENDVFPRVISKLDRKPETMAREFANLSQVHACIPEYVPRPLKFGKFDDFWALWMEGVPGLPFAVNHSSKTLPRIVEMLVSIHSAVRGQDTRDGSERYRRMVYEPFETLAGFGDSAAVRAGCARFSRQIGQEWVDSLPPIPQHGDLYPENIISFKGRQRVLDWETYGAIDLPFYDLLTLLVSLLIPERTEPVDLDPGLVRQVPGLIKLYARGMGLVVPDLELLLPVVLVNWFYLMWLDGRKKFTARIYQSIEHLFEHPADWQRIFLPA